MAPVILKMDLHCPRCVRRIRKLLIKDLYGVEDLWLSLETGYVVVAAGPCPDAARLKWRIQRVTGKPVDIVSDGSVEDQAPPPPDNVQMLYTGPPQPYGYPSSSYGGYGANGGYIGGGWVPPAAGLQYYHARQQQQYVPNEAPPVCFNDDNPNGCCTMQ